MAALQFAEGGEGGAGVGVGGQQREQERSESLERSLKELEGTKGGGRKEKVCGERYAKLKDISLNFSTLSA